MTEGNVNPDDSADSFRRFEKAFKDAQRQEKQDLKHAAAELRHKEVTDLIGIK
jgi:hypothetical protein